jgi:hypothetical protein
MNTKVHVVGSEHSKKPTDDKHETESISSHDESPFSAAATSAPEGRNRIAMVKSLMSGTKLSVAATSPEVVSRRPAVEPVHHASTAPVGGKQGWSEAAFMWEITGVPPVPEALCANYTAAVSAAPPVKAHAPAPEQVEASEVHVHRGGKYSTVALHRLTTPTPFETTYDAK